MTINVKVNGEDIDWTHVFTSGDELAVPGLGIGINNIAKAGLFIKVKIEPEGDMLTVKVGLHKMQICLQLGAGVWENTNLVWFPATFLVFQSQVHCCPHKYSESCFVSITPYHDLTRQYAQG